MKVYSADNSELMTISRIGRDGNNLIIHGKIMGSLPMKAIVRPEETRKGMKLLDWRMFLFLLRFIGRVITPSITLSKSKDR